MNNLVMQVRLFKVQTTNKCLLEEDKKILKSSFNLENNKKPDEEKIASFDKKKDYKLVKALENALITSSSSNINFTFHMQLLLSSQD